MQKFSKIVVALDFSESSDRALDAAIALATPFGAEVELVHVLSLPLPGVAPYDVLAPETFIRSCRKAAKEQLNARKHKVHDAGILVSTHLEDGPASGALVRVAEACGADVVVMGTHGNTGLKHALMGSVAERTMRHAPCSVLVVR